MSKKTEYPSKVRVVGKEFLPAREKMTVDGKEIPAREDTFNLYVMCGTMYDKMPDLYDTQPTVLAVSVEKMDYLRIRKSTEFDAVVRQNNGKLSVREMQGVTVLLRDDDVDEEELFAKELAEIERMEALEAQAKAAKKG